MLISILNCLTDLIAITYKGKQFLSEAPGLVKYYLSTLESTVLKQSITLFIYIPLLEDKCFTAPPIVAL